MHCTRSVCLLHAVFALGCWPHFFRSLWTSEKLSHPIWGKNYLNLHVFLSIFVAVCKSNKRIIILDKKLCRRNTGEPKYDLHELQRIAVQYFDDSDSMNRLAVWWSRDQSILHPKQQQASCAKRENCGAFPEHTHKYRMLQIKMTSNAFTNNNQEIELAWRFLFIFAETVPLRCWTSITGACNTNNMQKAKHKIMNGFFNENVLVHHFRTSAVSHL